MVTRAMLRRLAVPAACALAAGLLARPAPAQTLEPHSAGRMMGSTIEPDRKPRVPGTGGPAYNPNFTHGVKFHPGSGGYYGGNTYIIINGVPCYAPLYYSNGFGAYRYGDSDFSAGLRYGGLDLRYRQSGVSQRYYYGPPAGYGPAYGYAPTLPDTGAYPAAPSTYQPPSRRAAPGRSAGGDDNDYYLHRKPTALQKDPALAQAVADIESAFRTGNIATLERHVIANGRIVVQSKGRTRQPLAVSDYLAMTRDALQAMRTVRFTLDQVEPASNGAWMVYGAHVLRGEDGAERTFRVGFVLKKVEDRWIIAEVSAEPSR